MNKELVVIGGGISGIVAATSASKNGLNTLLIEKDPSLLLRMEKSDSKVKRALLNELQTESELSDVLLKRIKQSDVEIWLNSYVNKIEREDDLYSVSIITENGAITVKSKTVISATGSYEEIPNALFKTRGKMDGFFSKEAISRSFFEYGMVPMKNAVLYGSDIETFKLAERLKKSSINVEAVITEEGNDSYNKEYVKEYLENNQILFMDKTTITAVNGKKRISSITVSKIDSKNSIIKGTSKDIQVDSLVLSGIELPKLNVFKELNLKISKDTNGPIIDQDGMSSSPGLYFVGNSLYMSNDIDCLMLQAKECGFQSSRYRKSERRLVKITHDDSISFVSPERINLKSELIGIPFVFSAKENTVDSLLKVYADDKLVFKTKYQELKTYNLERLLIDFSRCDLNEESTITFSLE